MFDGMYEGKIKGLGAGAMMGLAAPYDLARSEQDLMARRLSNQARAAEYDEYEKNTPLRDLQRQLATAEGGDKLGAWNSGQAGRIAQGQRDLAESDTSAKLDKNKLEETRRKAEWYLMADQYLKSTNPAQLAGEGWAKVRDEGRSIGLDVPDEYSPEAHARITAKGQMAVKTIPHLQRAIEQEARGSNALKVKELENSRHLETERMRGKNRLDITRENNTTRQNIEAGKNARAVAIATTRNNGKMNLEQLASQTIGKLAADAEVSEWELAALEAVLKKQSNSTLANDISYKIAQLRMSSKDPKVREEAEAAVAEAVRNAGGELMNLINQKRGGSVAPTPGPTSAPVAPLPDASKAGDAIAPAINSLSKQFPNNKFQMGQDEKGPFFVPDPDPKTAEAQLAKLPSGTRVKTPDGKIRVKP